MAPVLRRAVFNLTINARRNLVICVILAVSGKKALILMQVVNFHVELQGSIYYYYGYRNRAITRLPLLLQNAEPRSNTNLLHDDM